MNIPVELHGAVRSARPRFRLLHATDKSPVGYERVCEREDKKVAWEDVVKGYEYQKGKFVVLNKRDFEKAALEKTKTIDILDFVESKAIDDRYFDTPYYILPSKGGERGYVVLREALRQSGRVGIGKVVLRETQHLAALSVVEDALVLSMMRFAAELVDPSRFKFPAAKQVRAPELRMAKMLVESLAADWKPEKYEDDYRENLMRVINAKVAGEKPELVAERPERGSDVVDLMERLRRSIEGRASSATRKPSRAKAAKPRKRRAA